MSVRLMILAGILSFGASGCNSGPDSGADDGPLGGALTVTGSVVDFQTGNELTGATSVATSGLEPAPAVTAQGATFTIADVPENSTFQILAGAAPTHRSTFSTSVVVTDSDVSGVKAQAVSEAYLGQLATAFGVNPTAAKGVLFVHLIDSAGLPRAGIAASNLVVAGGVTGPKFLDANLMPAPNATSSSSSGWAVFFEVPIGVATLGMAVSATASVDMPSSPINAATITLANATVADGAQILPTNVSFKNQIAPIFINRGCVGCHSGNGPGKDLGGLTLNGGSVYRELTLERPNTRVQLATPEKSLVLTMPSRESPPDRHPNITFASANDPDYLKLLVWIREGAKDN